MRDIGIIYNLNLIFVLFFTNYFPVCEEFDTSWTKILAQSAVNKYIMAFLFDAKDGHLKTDLKFQMSGNYLKIKNIVMYIQLWNYIFMLNLLFTI